MKEEIHVSTAVISPHIKDGLELLLSGWKTKQGYYGPYWEKVFDKDRFIFVSLFPGDRIEVLIQVGEYISSINLYDAGGLTTLEGYIDGLVKKVETSPLLDEDGKEL